MEIPVKPSHFKSKQTYKQGVLKKLYTATKAPYKLARFLHITTLIKISERKKLMLLTVKFTSSLNVHQMNITKQ